jgi:putative FmdB family regulatory protein
MPLFEYECAQCGEVTEVLEAANAEGEHVCPKCGSTRMEKRFSSFATGRSAGSSGGSCATGTPSKGT